MVLDPDFAVLGRHFVARPLYLAQASPPVGFDRATVAVANQRCPFKRDDSTRRALIQVVLDQLCYQVISVEVGKVIPKPRYRIEFRNELDIGRAV